MVSLLFSTVAIAVSLFINMAEFRLRKGFHKIGYDLVKLGLAPHGHFIQVVPVSHGTGGIPPTGGKRPPSEIFHAKVPADASKILNRGQQQWQHMVVVIIIEFAFSSTYTLWCKWRKRMP